MVTGTVQRNGNTSLSPRISQEELAQLVGLSRQRLNQALKRLEKAGLLQIEYRGITALDLDRLRT
jgi:CRP/FNR family transcriptional regulator, cyclic AMP receptor protein